MTTLVLSDLERDEVLQASTSRLKALAVLLMSIRSGKRPVSETTLTVGERK